MRNFPEGCLPAALAISRIEAFLEYALGDEPCNRRSAAEGLSRPDVKGPTAEVNFSIALSIWSSLLKRAKMASSFVSVCILSVAMSALGLAVVPKLTSPRNIRVRGELFSVEPRLALFRLGGRVNESSLTAVALLQVRSKCSGNACLSSLKRSDPDLCIFANRSSVTTNRCTRDVATTT
mmetsp:Transcript_29534/g.61802  ORF Transcript_29534/g.61802 Transcript_29534/m.61802 type:complete len:179 (-) Transcript_29534:1179-1715(-)